MADGSAPAHTSSGATRPAARGVPPARTADGPPTGSASPPIGPGAARHVPAGAGIEALRAAARGCQGCELHRDATQTVFSKGSPVPRVVLIGEQPGDMEDQQGLPFVGPAGRLLDRALADAGLDPARCYVTNAVKHFHFTLKASSRDGAGRRRIHRTPDPAHITACRPWLTAELAVLDPEVVVTLGATAGQSVLGPGFRVTRQRGRLLPWAGGRPGEPAARAQAFLVPTIHPSAVLRAPDQDTAYAGLVADLRVAASVLTPEAAHV